jgi:O-antigen/teichoic acid export membrane protein
MTLAVQAFRMGAEPFFFNQSVEKNAKAVYATVMKYFILICCVIFIGVGMFPDVFKIIIGENYHEGLHIVPVLLLANLFLGIYYNQSVWYKLTDKTAFATMIPIAGAVITLGLNYFLIPALGYSGSAWATLGCYFSMVVISWLMGQKYYFIPYNLKKILFYLISSVLICISGLYILNHIENNTITIVARFVLFLLFIVICWWLDIGKIVRGKKQKT